MTVAARVIVLGCLSFALAAGAAAQVRPSGHKLPSEATIEGWLLSDDPRLVAWGAYDVLLSRNEALTPDLLNLAMEWQPLTQESAADGIPAQLSPVQLNHRDAMAAVLDAIIQMDVPVPPETLRALAPDFPNAVAILLGRMDREDAEPLALDLYHSPPQSALGLQYVSAAMLAQHPPSGFAADLLAGIEVGANILIVLPDSPPFGFGTSGCFACRMQTKLPRGNWPPIGQYSLSMEKGDRSRLLVSGIDPIYAKRNESDTYRDPCGEPSLGPDQRQRLIAEMLDVSPDTIPWKTHPSTAIVFQSDAQFSLDLLRFIGEEKQKYRQTALALVAHGVMTNGEVEQYSPKLELYTHDMRGSGSSPLPKIAPLPANVEWPNQPAWN